MSNQNNLTNENIANKDEAGKPRQDSLLNVVGSLTEVSPFSTEKFKEVSIKDILCMSADTGRC